MTMISPDTSRFTDLSDDPVDQLLLPMKGYEKPSLLPFIETIKPVSEFFYEIEDYIYAALHNCQNPLDGLTEQESTSMYL